MRSAIAFTVPLEGLSKMERFVRILSRAVTRSDLPFNGVTQMALGKDCRWGCDVQLQGMFCTRTFSLILLATLCTLALAMSSQGKSTFF